MYPPIMDEIYGWGLRIGALRFIHQILHRSPAKPEYPSVQWHRRQSSGHHAEAYTSAVKVSKTKNVKSFNIEAPDPLFTHFYQRYTIIEGENEVKEGLQPMSYKYWLEVDV